MAFIKFAVVAVNRHKRAPSAQRLVAKNCRLSPVAVVHVPVDDHHPAAEATAEHGFGGDAYRVQQAVAAKGFGGRVVSGRANERERRRMRRADASARLHGESAVGERDVE